MRNLIFGIMESCLIDSPESLLKQIQEALEQVDVLVTSGGVSMGEKVSASTIAVVVAYIAANPSVFRVFFPVSKSVYRKTNMQIISHFLKTSAQ